MIDLQKSIPLNIAPERFTEAYNLDVSEYVEKRTGSGGKTFSYLSGAHAIKLFRQYFPELEVACVFNEETNSYIFEEPDRGFFILPYVYGYDNELKVYRASTPLYFSVLSMKMDTVLPDEVENFYNKNTRKTEVKTKKQLVVSTSNTSQESNKNTESGFSTKKLVAEDMSFEVDDVPSLLGNVQLFDKCIVRAKVKAIAYVVGLGLKLWTLEDLSEEVTLDKFESVTV